MFRLISQIPKGSKGLTRTLTTNKSEQKPNISLPEFADVVVVGGGSAGCNALYQLGKRGVKAVLLEKSKLISGTTWHTAGLIWGMKNVNDLEMELLKVTREVLIHLEEETGINPGFISNGGLYIAHSPERMAEYERLVTAGKAFDIDTKIISNTEAKKLFPLLNENAFAGALYAPKDGAVDPAMLINALTKSAKNHGCKIFEDCPVTKILTKDTSFGYKEVTGVQTPYGTIKTSCILNASGAWSGNLIEKIGLKIPLVPMKHAYVVTEPVDGMPKLPNVRDPDINLYFRVLGGSIGIGGYEPNPIILKTAPQDFSFNLYELDWSVFNTHIESMTKLMPALSKTGIRSTVCGPESFTPDHKPIMGEDPRCTGLFYSCGYNSSGMMLGGGCGEQIALWLLNGRPSKHMFNFDIRRFLPEQREDMIWINERSHEAYAKNYNIIFCHEEALSGRNFKTDPFHDMLIEKGAVMEERQGWERPGWFLKDKTVTVQPYDFYGQYGSALNEDNEYKLIMEKDCSFDLSPYHDIIGEEALSCRQNVALFDISYFGKFYLCGPDAQEVADYVFTADTNQNYNKIVYSCMLNKNGGTEGDCTLTAVEAGSSGLVDPIFKGKGFYIVTGGLSAYHSFTHINKIITDKGFNASLHDATETIGVLSLQGRKSISIMQKLMDYDVTNESFPYLTSKLYKVKDQLVRIFRVSFVGELGFELHIPKQSCKIVYDALMKIGIPYNLKLAGYRALYSLSNEKGYHLWGSDLRIDDTPIEAGLEFTCRKKGHYLGKNKIENIKRDGIKKKLVQLHLQKDVPIWGMETVYRNNELVGYLRRAEYGYELDKFIGQSYIKHPNGQNITKEYLESGSYEIEVRGKRYPATLYIRSPFDRENERVLGIYEKKTIL
ncbi:sarcosine dehydrogenase, mitochondrial [Prorops nasuta]|uniref:sarcosine dehydrogenase, mitochondrial n=1 Tax=Prorops nasuta TaxID=863751 RepID=UPI0034CD5B90